MSPSLQSQTRATCPPRAASVFQRPLTCPAPIAPSCSLWPAMLPNSTSPACVSSSSQRHPSVETVVPHFVDEKSTLATRWSWAAYLRLYFDGIFDERWQRVVYFDADVKGCRAWIRRCRRNDKFRKRRP